MSQPEGYRKAARLMKLAEDFSLPIITFIDTPGAYPGIESEERGMSEAIAKNLSIMSGLKVPIIVIITGEGGSGGALAIGVGDHISMLEYSIYSVASPEACASIVWRDNSKAQEAAEEARPYAEKMSIVIEKLASSTNASSNSPLLVGNGKDKTHLIIVATSERGLCGAFNSSIVRLAKNHINHLISDGNHIKILTIGKKGREQLKRDFGDYMIEHVDLSEIKKISYDNASNISDNIISKFFDNEFDIATIFYNQFESVISQIPQSSQLIPIKFNLDIIFDCPD